MECTIKIQHQIQILRNTHEMSETWRQKINLCDRSFFIQFYFYVFSHSLKQPRKLYYSCTIFSGFKPNYDIFLNLTNLCLRLNRAKPLCSHSCNSVF